MIHSKLYRLRTEATASETDQFANAIEHLRRIFERKNWELKAEEELYQNLFIRFAELFIYLDQNESRLIITLLEDYLLCTGSDYPTRINKIVKRIANDITRDVSEVYVIPILNDAKKQNGGSGTSIAYDIRNKLDRYLHTKLEHYRVYKYASIDAIDFDDTRNSMFLFVDDFVGSGNQAETYLRKSVLDKVDRESIAFASLIAQQEGKYRLSQLCNRTYFSEVRKKGISDSDKFNDVIKALDTMQQIGRKLNIACVLGKYDSEALVTMKRTPNNTFGVFWSDNYGNRKGIPPFPR